MEELSNRYGWTPDQIRSQRRDDIGAYLEIIGMQNYLKAYNKGNGKH